MFGVCVFVCRRRPLTRFAGSRAFILFEPIFADSLPRESAHLESGATMGVGKGS